MSGHDLYGYTQGAWKSYMGMTGGQFSIPLGPSATMTYTPYPTSCPTPRISIVGAVWYPFLGLVPVGYSGYSSSGFIPRPWI